MIGLPQVGRRTLFGLLTGAAVKEGAEYPLHGVTEVQDPRFDRLVEMYRPRKTARARLEIDLLPPLEKEALLQGKIFRDIASLDAVCHVVRAFADDSVYHVEGTVDPRRDVDAVHAELVLHDLLFVEKRLERLEKDIRSTNNPVARKDKELLSRFKGHLEAERPLRLLDLSPDEKKGVSSYPLVTMKELIVVLNVSEDARAGGDDEALRARCAPLGVDLMRVSAKVEAEIAEMPSEAERKEFLAALGVPEPAIHALTRLCQKALRLISYFTVGEDEVKQWLVRRGALAPEAAGVIHSDLERGFIRAEMMKYDDLVAAGDEKKLRETGKFHSKGRDYLVEDGDILSFLAGT